MDRMERVKKSDIEKIMKALEDAPVPTEGQVSNSEAIRLLAPTIRRMQKRGHSLESIVSVLGTTGLRIGVTTLKDYLYRSKDKGGEKSRGAGQQPEKQLGKEERRRTSKRSSVPSRDTRVVTSVNAPVGPSLDMPASRVVDSSKTELRKGTFTPREDSEQL